MSSGEITMRKTLATAAIVILSLAGATANAASVEPIECLAYGGGKLLPASNVWVNVVSPYGLARLEARDEVTLVGYSARAHRVRNGRGALSVNFRDLKIYIEVKNRQPVCYRYIP
jgi:hypothetical protein